MPYVPPITVGKVTRTGRILWLLPVILLASTILIQPSPPLVLALDSPVQLSVISEDSSTSNLVEPTFIPGTSFNMTIQASNLPPIVDQASGGLSGFDIGLKYNGSVIKAGRAAFAGPLCPSSDGCILDMPQNNTLTIANSMGVQSGVARLAMVVIGPSHRAVLPSVQGLPAVLFRIEFDVVGKGLTSINIDTASSQLLGFTGGCGNLVSYTVMNGLFDNRAPFRVSASPLSPTVMQGQSVTMQVNVSLVNSAGNGNVNLLLSGINPIPMGAGPEFTYQFSPTVGTLNGPAGMNTFLSSLQISVALQTPQGSYPLTIAGVIAAPAANAFQYNYNFTLIVVSDLIFGYVASPVAIRPSPPPTTPTSESPIVSSGSILATFSLNATPSLGHPVTFTAIGIWCSSPTYTIHWDFGDGSTGTSNPATHAYSKSGRFTVTLTVTDNGNRYSSTQDLIIPAPPSPASGLDVYPLLAGGLTAFVLVALVSALFLKSRRRKNSR